MRMTIPQLQLPQDPSLLAIVLTVPSAPRPEVFTLMAVPSGPTTNVVVSTETCRAENALHPADQTKDSDLM